MSTDSPSDPLTENPLLVSTANIGSAQSLAFAVIYGIFFVVMIVRMCKGPGRTFAYGLMTVFAAIRVVTFALRYVVSKKSPLSSEYEGLVIAASVTLVAGFYLFLEGVMDLVYKWHQRAHNIIPSDIDRVFVQWIRHTVLAGVSAIGIVGSIKQVDDISSSTPDSSAKTWQDLRIASGALFLAIATLNLLFVFYVLITTRPPLRKQISSMGLTTLILVILSLTTTVEAVYRVWVASTYHGFIVKEEGLDVLIFTPEAIALIVFCVMDMNDMGDMGFWEGKSAGQLRRKEHHRMMETPNPRGP